ncbi:MAG: PHP domain-containing protein [Desulfotalea sp.]
MSLDLHIHSNYSDGSCSPYELAELATKKGLKGISITDHDNIDSTKHISELEQTFSISIIPGVELSLNFGDISIHLLVYLFDSTSKYLHSFLTKVQDGRTSRNNKMLSGLYDEGLTISNTERAQLEANNQLGRPHMARLLVQKGLAKNMNEAFSKYLVLGCKSYVERPDIQLKDAMKVITKAKGLAVLAHPLSSSIFRQNLEQNIEETAKLGVHGLEAYYPTHSKKSRKALIAIADRLDLVLSGGSDYHGSFRAGTRLAGGKNVTVPFDLLEKLQKRHQDIYHSI